MDTTYKKFIEFVKELKTIDGAIDLLGWDKQVYMPVKGNEQRAEQITLLSEIYHKYFTSRRMKRYIEELNKPRVFETLTPEEKCNVRETTRVFTKEIKIPTKLFRELTKTVSLAYLKWVNAKKNSNFDMFIDSLERIIILKKQIAEKIGYEKARYDVMLDDFEPYMKTEKIEKIFSGLENMLLPLSKKIIDICAGTSTDILHQKYPVDKQEVIGREIVKAMGYDFERGRIDVTEHPFSTGRCDDVRITTKYNETDVCFSIFSTIHEAGHALYGQGLKREHYGTPMGEGISHGIHESQSRLWENVIGRSYEFCTYYYPRLQDLFPEQLKNVQLKDFHTAINVVKPSFIRIKADEITYNFHIILRFEIEKELINNDVNLKELPSIWNEKMNKYLGITPPDDAKGVLQDVHWSSGYFGYFPSYTFGNLYAAQIYNKICKEIPDIKPKISEGNLITIKQWLNDNIHQYGMLYSAEELIKKITGEQLNPKYLIEYIRSKYSSIYDTSI